MEGTPNPGGGGAPSPAPPKAVRLYFDVGSGEPWHRAELERLRGQAGPGDVRMVAKPEDAEFVLRASGCLGYPERAAWGTYREQAPGGPFVAVWDGSDAPTGFCPGLYCSLPRFLHDPRRHASFCYPFEYNECVDAADPGEARKLFNFVGGLTSGLRMRMLEAVSGVPGDEKIIQVRNGPWQAMFDRSGLDAKKQYAEAIRRSRFTLCPRGNGVGSIRLFEVLRAGRVPVILSDAYVPPPGVDWASCSVTVKESDVARLPAILRERSADWGRMAANARRVYETRFAGAQLWKSVASELVRIRADYVRLSLGARARILAYPSLRRASRAAAILSLRTGRLLARTRGGAS